MRLRISVPEAHVQPDVLDAALEAVTRLDEALIRSGNSPTSHQLLGQGAVWRPEPPGDEHFDHGGIIAARGHGDCDDWAPLHAATLRVTGEDPGARAIVLPSGATTYHALVERSDGSHDDPSIAAGMKVSGGIVIGGPCEGFPYDGAAMPTFAPMTDGSRPGIAVIRGPEGWHARADIPWAGSPIMAGRMRGRSNVTGCYGLCSTAYEADPRVAAMSAISGAVLCGQASGCADPEHILKLVGLYGMCCGEDPLQVLQDMKDYLASLGYDPNECEHYAQAFALKIAPIGDELFGTTYSKPKATIGSWRSDIRSDRARDSLRPY
jgi:hypothetical protein